MFALHPWRRTPALGLRSGPNARGSALGLGLILGAVWAAAGCADVLTPTYYLDRGDASQADGRGVDGAVMVDATHDLGLPRDGTVFVDGVSFDGGGDATLLADAPALSDGGGADAVVGADTGVVCPAGEALCATACADLHTDRLNCGTCGVVCLGAGTHEVASCAGGVCHVQCAPGYADCDSTVPGCETPIGTDGRCNDCTSACARDLQCVPLATGFVCAPSPCATGARCCAGGVCATGSSCGGPPGAMVCSCGRAGEQCCAPGSPTGNDNGVGSCETASCTRSDDGLAYCPVTVCTTAADCPRPQTCRPFPGALSYCVAP